MIKQKRLLLHEIWTCYQCRGWARSTATYHEPAQRRKSERLPNSPARTRFAPSPTGYLHLGSLRTALFNYLTAKATGGQFILRVEDTDQVRILIRSRAVPDAEQRLYKDLKWAGLQWDEGPDVGGPFGPYRQSERTPLYRQYAQQLLQNGHAYRCFCSPMHLRAIAQQKHLAGLPSDYDRTCASIPEEESDDRAAKGREHVIRLKMPQQIPSFKDLTYGVIKDDKFSQGRHAKHVGFEDPVLIKSDGCPTYHLANVVDDHTMGITHVIRAAEWMSSTPKHVVMYDAFGWEPPIFAHVGLLQDEQNQKLSKRTGSDGVESFRQAGIFPEALVNFLALLGWSHKLNDDFLPIKKLTEIFDLKFTKGNTMIDLKKLTYLQQRYAEAYAKEGGERYERMIAAVHEVALQRLSKETTIKEKSEIEPLIASLISTSANHYVGPAEFFERHVDLFCDRPRDPWKPQVKNNLLADNLPVIQRSFDNIPQNDWCSERLHQVLEDLNRWLTSEDRARDDELADRKSVSNALFHYLRWALMGGRPGPKLADLMVHLGREHTLRRLKSAKHELGDMLMLPEQGNAKNR